MRVIVGQETVPSDAHMYPWDLTMPPATFLVDYAAGLQAGRSSLVANANDATALRTVRANAIADAAAAPGFFYGVIPIANTAFVMVMRDHLPFCRPTDGLWEPE
jgi:hypothetical protein